MENHTINIKLNKAIDTWRVEHRIGDGPPAATFIPLYHGSKSAAVAVAIRELTFLIECD